MTNGELRPTNATRPVGLIGLGLMGQAFTHRLRQAKLAVRGFDIDAGRRTWLTDHGEAAADTIADIAESCHPVILAVFDTDQVEQVVEGGLIPALGRGQTCVVLCTSTCAPDRIAALAARAWPRGVRLLETPVSGTSEQVRRGEGVGLIGGDAAIASEVAPVLDALFAHRFHIGRVGDGGRAKLAVNLILGLNRLALAEGLVFAGRLGLDPAAFLAVARGSAAWSQVMDTKGGKMVARDFSPEGRTRQTLKDVHLMLDQAARVGQKLPLISIHADVLEACLRHGEGDEDNSVVIEEIRRRTFRPTGAAT
jgi:3-hydroxyisobutyrate dehydrogenase-like beta-hydroxyacid dehydrogenase